MLSHFSCVQFCVTLWTVACQAPPSMGLSSQEYWNGFLCPPPGDLPNLGIDPVSLMSPALAGKFFTTEPPDADAAGLQMNLVMAKAQIVSLKSLPFDLN